MLQPPPYCHDHKLFNCVFDKKETDIENNIQNLTCKCLECASEAIEYSQKDEFTEFRKEIKIKATTIAFQSKIWYSWKRWGIYAAFPTGTYIRLGKLAIIIQYKKHKEIPGVIKTPAGKISN